MKAAQLLAKKALDTSLVTQHSKVAPQAPQLAVGNVTSYENGATAES